MLAIMVGWHAHMAEAHTLGDDHAAERLDRQREPRERQHTVFVSWVGERRIIKPEGCVKNTFSLLRRLTQREASSGIDLSV